MPCSDKRFILSVLRQIRGIADAIAHIHQFRVTSEQSTTSSQSAGFHHDIKPENILVFSTAGDNDRKDQFGTLKLSDFGTSWLPTDRGGLSHDLFIDADAGGGTTIYAAPEAWSNTPMDHTADIWSYGCVIHELLCWIMQGSRWSRIVYHESRIFGTRFDQPGQIISPLLPFWTFDHKNQAVLDPVVSILLVDLYNQMPDTSPLLNILPILRQSLQIDPKLRPSASQIFDCLDRILREATEKEDEFCLRSDFEDEHYSKVSRTILEGQSRTYDQEQYGRFFTEAVDQPLTLRDTNFKQTRADIIGPSPLHSLQPMNIPRGRCWPSHYALPRDARMSGAPAMIADTSHIAGPGCEVEWQKLFATAPARLSGLRRVSKYQHLRGVAEIEGVWPSYPWGC